MRGASIKSALKRVRLPGRKSSHSHSTQKPPAPDSGPPDDEAGHQSSADRPLHALNGLNEVVAQTVVIYLKICSVMGASGSAGTPHPIQPFGPLGLCFLPYPPARILFNPSVAQRPPLHWVPTLSATPGARRRKEWRGRGRHQEDVGCGGAGEGCATLRSSNDTSSRWPDWWNFERKWERRDLEVRLTTCT
ncbi:hypothetical protein E2C01_012020 [Portunus trituberculatus]|uniref:Uncharacterized protein n=1 Tax=Portunus trituberculatus TaxID=210409 RepID=A0A5B7DCD9_PORTR|nr:hypothetical protein [Portunus trituberculatus]